MKRQELIDKWLEALESGKFKQGQGSLSKKYGTKDARYCCLGVLCIVAKENGMRLPKDTLEYGQILPNNVAKAVGITSLGEFKIDVVRRGKQYESLVGMNDYGVTFKTIAKVIREQMAAGNFVK